MVDNCGIKRRSGRKLDIATAADCTETKCAWVKWGNIKYGQHQAFIVTKSEFDVYDTVAFEKLNDRVVEGGQVCKIWSSVQSIVL